MDRTKTLARSVLALGLAAPALGFAASDETIIEQIIVTAQKRASALQDVPFSVAAASEQQIRDSGSTNIVDLARNFAGLTITDLGPGQSQVAIRGISAGQVVRDLVGGVKESVGVYLDESAISQALFTPDLDLFDLERFEVLRGPQGTLFGAGSSAGTVRYITRQPQLGQFEGAAEASALPPAPTTDVRRQPARRRQPADGRHDGAARGRLLQRAGRASSIRCIRAAPCARTSTAATKYGARVALLFQPNENLSITPRIVYQKLETDGYPRIDRLQHPRQSVHDDAAGGESRRARPGDADPRRHRRRVHAGRPGDRTRVSAA